MIQSNHLVANHPYAVFSSEVVGGPVHMPDSRVEISPHQPCAWCRSHTGESLMSLHCMSAFSASNHIWFPNNDFMGEVEQMPVHDTQQLPSDRTVPPAFINDASSSAGIVVFTCLIRAADSIAVSTQLMCVWFALCALHTRTSTCYTRTPTRPNDCCRSNAQQTTTNEFAADASSHDLRSRGWLQFKALFSFC